MTLKNHILFWSGVAVTFFVIVAVFNAVLLPFVLGGAIAYLLNPLIHRFNGWGVARGPAICVILGLFFVFTIAFCITVFPIAYRELMELVHAAPGYVEYFIEWVQPLSQRVQEALGKSDVDVNGVLSKHVGTFLNTGQKVIGSVIAGGQALISVLSVIVFTPVIAYFLMKEWTHITNWIKDLMPRDQKPTIESLLGQIDRKISGFVRGQITVAFILGVFYALALSLAGLKYGFLIGLSAGLLSVIPMVGSVLGLVVSVVMAWFQFADPMFVLLIAAIFLGGQFVEGNFLTPKLVGDSVGMHPLWVFFALIAGGALFGIVGMFIAIPVAAIVGVLASFAISVYKSTSYYKGQVKKSKPTKKKTVS